MNDDRICGLLGKLAPGEGAALKARLRVATSFRKAVEMMSALAASVNARMLISMRRTSP